MIRRDLFIAAEYGRSEPFEDFPLSEDIDFHKDEHKNTLLSIAAQKGHTELMRLLIRKGADICAENKDRKTPLSYAIENGDMGVFTAILAHESLPGEQWMKLCGIFEEHLSDKPKMRKGWPSFGLFSQAGFIHIKKKCYTE
ncbi:hypothetical protein CFAM422_010237 [Trichoderma lentiforme]|uniref:Ankyrin repeat protein n=1 Tax=Trichoderma lentiforme TaxID=1567552 RepID=A0A9P4X615_9HYPO|nr:hypothetical protein CFAM422_010237 [Trichoderma lentiforme]